ncbi:MAG: hypothetical protein IPL42_00110 [Saprospiraceae bacterium]|nr:hypothetical protein [Saprospiraceae bacterium]
MKVLITISVLLINLYFTIPFKGYRGVYYIIGTAYINNSNPLRNKEFQLEYGRNVERIKTNRIGEFIVKINFEFPCLSGIRSERFTKENIERFTNSFNPKYIFFDYNGRCIEIENYFYIFKEKDINLIEPLKFNHDLKF